MTHTDKAAAVEANVAAVLRGLDGWAQHMAARFGGPVYLLGSVLYNPAPRDYDIRIVIPDHEFAARYGMPMERMEFPEYHPFAKRGLVSGMVVPWGELAPSQRWVDDIAKLGAHLSLKLRHNIDLKVWPEAHWREPYPKPITLAEPSPKWWIDNKYNPAPE